MANSALRPLISYGPPCSPSEAVRRYLKDEWPYEVLKDVCERVGCSSVVPADESYKWGRIYGIISSFGLLPEDVAKGRLIQLALDGTL